MADEPQRLSALKGVLEPGIFGARTPGITLCERRNLSIVQVAAYADTAQTTRNIIEDFIGALPPSEPNRSIAAGAAQICWIGPHKWWIVQTDRPRDANSLARELGDRAAVTTQGHGRTCIRLSGPSARDLLPKGCTLDFHPGHFTVGDCAQTNLGHVNSVINCIDDAPEFDLFIPRSYAVSFWEWITDAAMEFGYKVIASP